MSEKFVTYPYRRCIVNIIGRIEKITQKEGSYPHTIFTIKFGLIEKLDVYSPHRTDLNVGDNVEIIGDMTMNHRYHRPEGHRICEKVPLVVARYVRKIGTAHELYPSLSEEEKNIADVIEALSKASIEEENK